MHEPQGFSTEYRQHLPAIDPDSVQVIKNKTLVQVVDILDIGTSLSSQLDKLIAKQEKVAMINEEQINDEGPTNTKTAKYTVRDSGDNFMFLIFHTAPTILPSRGTYLLLKRGCELRRGILIGKPDTVQVLKESWPIHVKDRIEVLQKQLDELPDVSAAKKDTKNAPKNQVIDID